MKTVALCVVGICLTALAVLQRPSSTDDFRSFYRGAKLAVTAQSVYLYPALDPNTGKDGTYLPYIRIPSYALMLKPLTALSYPKARALWIALIVLAFGGVVWLYPGPRNKLAIALCFSLPVVYAMILGQDIAFVLLITLMASRLSSSGREYPAGLVASLLSIKPIYLIPAVLVFTARSRRGTFGLLLGTAIQLAISFAIGGSHWPPDYLALLRNPSLDLEPRRMLNLRAITTSLSLPPELFVLGAIAIMGWLWVIAHRLPLSKALILALPLAVIASPHAYIYDAVVAIPLFVMFSDLPVLVALTPVPYFALMMNQPFVVLAGSAAFIVATLLAAHRASAVKDTVRRVPRILTALPDGNEFPAS